MLAGIMEKGNPRSRAVEMKAMRHPWDMQAPELFAQCVGRWIEGKELPEEMTAL